MSTQCYAMVRGSTVRVTRLDKRGAPWALGWPTAYVVSKAVTRVSLDPLIDTGGTEMLRNAEDERRIVLVKPDRTLRYSADIEFVGVDPGMLSLVSGVPLVYNAAGDVVGFDAQSKMKATAFALEVWTKLAGAACADGTQRWGYTVFPFLKGGWLTGFKFSNAAVKFSLRGATTQWGSRWNGGPYSVDHSQVMVSGNTAYRQIITDFAPPLASQGIEEVFEGGDASMTSDNVLDGEFVVTSPRVVDGGEA